ncbi:hypothetical protein PoB_006160600 [Plakobranchus ocellatus]|uniref:Uncharacterized protein n=1 Tax=Plakobranchus ocellatus TaxID=259542 RepID=A0AAV4CTS0_9GAST|nr:hypothetical protein PoB_006160600 [Plakobranchus ocellatus]
MLTRALDEGLNKTVNAMTVQSTHHKKAYKHSNAISYRQVDEVVEAKRRFASGFSCAGNDGKVALLRDLTTRNWSPWRGTWLVFRSPSPDVHVVSAYSQPCTQGLETNGADGCTGPGGAHKNSARLFLVHIHQL